MKTGKATGRAFVRRWLSAVSALALVLGAAQFTFAAQASADVIGTSCSGGAIQIIAHQDDDLLFQSPDILRDVDQGRCVRTVYVTAGDSGYEDDYWQSRESGAEAAWAQAAGVSNSWTTSTISLAGKSVRMRTLKNAPNVSLIFMRLPDGFPLGTGSAAQGYQSLYRLLTGAISKVTAVDGSASYTSTTLRNSLLAAIQANNYTWVRTQDYVTYYGGDQDHYDHHSVAFLARDATGYYENDCILSSYLGYGDFVLNGAWPANIASSDLSRKTSIFTTYAKYDDEVDISEYQQRGWLARQYVIAINGDAAAANAGLDQTAAAGTQVTLNGTGSTGVSGLTYSWSQTSGPTVTLSSTTASTATFTPTAAGSYVFKLTATSGSTSSTDSVTITVTGTSASSSPSTSPSSTASSSASSSTLSNLAMVGATVTQSSQVSGQEGKKAVDGVAKGYPGYDTNEWSTDGGGAGSWITLTWDTPVTLSKIVLYDRPNSNDRITAGTLVFSDGSSVAVGQLNNDGSATTINFTARTVTSVQLQVTKVSSKTENVGLAEFEAWGATATTAPSTTTSAPSTTASTTAPTTTAPSTTAPTTTAPTTTAPSTTATSTATNVARQSTVKVTASSQQSGSKATKAVDGVIAGYPADSSKEWATDRGKAGSWITLTWPSAVTVNKIVLYDRPNLDDQVLSGTLVFSDGSTIAVGQLNNDGSATTISFDPKTISSVQFKVDSVSSSTYEVGLAELEVYASQ